MKIKKILIANRGEIALRVIRAAREMGLATVAIYSDADRISLPARYADFAYRIGPSPSSESYLNIRKIIEAAKFLKADSIHPGYGFLSENADFAQICIDEGFTWIGPPPEAIKSMGDKTTARAIVSKDGVPVIPGCEDALKDEREAIIAADEIGYPVMLKSVFGGGGKGMRIIKNKDDLTSSFKLASSEAKNAFGDGSLYVEKFLEKPRHIEMQILGDNHGNVVYLGERECSLQRRHQKVIEESPSVIVDEELRRNMGKMAVKAAIAAHYSSAGTIEFLMDEKHNFYFMEMNTRLQVEHPVTEMVTGMDIVKAQIRIAEGQELWFSQDEIAKNGWAIECRLYAEDPLRNFIPCPGKIHSIRLPEGPGIRIDSALFPGMEVTPYYDPLLAKVITWGIDRKEARQRMIRALEELQIRGIGNNCDFLRGIISSSGFERGEIDTAFIERFMDSNQAEIKEVPDEAIIASLVAYLNRSGEKVTTTNATGNWKNNNNWKKGRAF